MSAYIIAYVQVTNPQQYEAYKTLSTHAMEVCGATVCVRSTEVEVLEGDWSPERVVVLKFPDMPSAKAFYNSPQYALARDARAGAAVMRMVVVEGF